MRIGVISDTHGHMERVKAALEQMGEVDIILHAGDHFRDVLLLQQTVTTPIIGVRGNCDFSGPREEIVQLDGINILLIHGHQYGVKGSLQRLAYRGAEAGVKVVVFGHTHIPEIEWSEDMLLFNPGSIGSPRGASSHPTYGILYLEEGKVHPVIEEVKATK
ncbi:MAG TPA: metallophosphoesterase [Bacillota bacterium]|nr:metallophosphoesterase [Bacillota bacterium]